MSKVLFIRVVAETYDEKDVVGTWPKLYASVWPTPEVDSTASPAAIVRKVIPARERGALELVAAFIDYARFGNGRSVKELQGYADKLETVKRDLDEALGDRDVARASGLINTIENTLDDVENTLRG